MTVVRRYSNPQYYLNGATIPECFLEADRQMDEKHKDDPVPVKKIKEVPMPFIAGTKGTNGPIIVTEDWYVKKKRKKKKEESKDRRDTQIEMMQLLSKKDRLKFKLGELDPSKKKDSKRMVAINVELRDIDAELQMLQSQSGIDLNKLEKGSRLARFIGNFKRWAKKKIKRIKNWFHENREIILGILSLIIPLGITTTVRRLII